MAQIAIADTYRVVCRGIRGGEDIINVFHFTTDAGAAQLTASQYASVADAFAKLYSQGSSLSSPERGINNHLDATYTYFGTTVQWIDAVPYTDAYELLNGSPGTAAGDPLPLNVALCVSLRTGVASRNARGRTFLGGFSEAGSEEASDGYPRPTAALTLAVRNAFQDLELRLQAIAATLDLAVASYTTATSRPVTSIRTENVWSSQRRRQQSIPVTTSTSATILA